MIDYDLEYLELLKVFGTNFLAIEDLKFLRKMNIIKKGKCIICGEEHQYTYLLTCNKCKKEDEEKILIKKIDKKIEQIKKEN